MIYWHYNIHSADIGTLIGAFQEARRDIKCMLISLWTCILIIKEKIHTCFKLNPYCSSWCRLRGAVHSVVEMSNDCLEVSFKSSYNHSTRGTKLPLTFYIRSWKHEFIWSFYFMFSFKLIKVWYVFWIFRYILRSGVSGFYCYAIYEHPAGSPAFDLAQTRMVFKLRREK